MNNDMEIKVILEEANVNKDFFTSNRKENNLKCPFCQQELKDQWVGQYVAHEYFDCPKCKMNGNPKLWQELIRTRKALEIAKDTLHWYDDNYDSVVARNTLDEITALEQKDVK